MITSDSGLGHVAASQKIKTITIFGPANHKRTQPWGENNFSIKSKNAPLCSPCYKYLDFKFSCPHKIKCLTTINSNDILATIQRALLS